MSEGETENELVRRVADVDPPAAHANDRSGDLSPVACPGVKSRCRERVAGRLRHVNSVLAVEDEMLSEELTPREERLGDAAQRDFGVDKSDEIRVRIVVFRRRRVDGSGPGLENNPVPCVVRLVPVHGGHDTAGVYKFVADPVGVDLDGIGRRRLWHRPRADDFCVCQRERLFVWDFAAYVGSRCHQDACCAHNVAAVAGRRVA